MTNTTIASSGGIIWNKLRCLVTSSSLDFISSCSPEVYGQKTQGISLRVHKSIYHEMKAAKIQQTRKQKRSYHFSSFKWDQSCLCLPPPFWADRHYQYRLYCFWWGKKMFFFSIVIALLSSTTVCLCWFWCCGRENTESDAVCISIISLSCSKVFWENMNCMSNKGHRFNCPVWPGQPHPPNTYTYRACAHTRTQMWSLRWRWNFQEY